MNDQLVVLNARIYKSQMQVLHQVAQEHNISVADLLREVLEQALPTYSPLHVSIPTRLDKIFTVVANIYATQLAAKSESAMYDRPEGIFLIPTTDKKGMFICQGCGQDRPNKKRHIIQVGNENLSFGDCCYFNDHYKEIVRQLL